VTGDHYAIRGGIEGRERLRILSRVMQPTTLALLNRAGVGAGMTCLDVGCGGGDVAFDLARLVGPSGRVVGADIDGTKLEIARHEAAQQGLTNVEFLFDDIAHDHPRETFDVVHARFVLTHLPDPARALAHMRAALRPGGTIVLEDIDFRGHFSYPESPALWRYVDLYTQLVRQRGGDPNIGPRLPSLLADAGFQDVRVNVVQPAAVDGEAKLITPITMQNIADAALAAGFMTRAEVDELTQELYDFAHTPGTFGTVARIVEAWATR
jgi:ubiquinone/menaquinone biosynthesis C-methylase UbiE